MSDPSFEQLFRRSKYAKTEPSAGLHDASKQNRREVFAVSAVGFVLKHDQNGFKRKFLENIVGISEEFDAFKVEVQAEHESDLRLVDAKGKRLVVIEFKIRSEINAHQDPWAAKNPLDANSLFWSSTKGYGNKLLKNSVGCDRIWYITIQRLLDFEEKKDVNEFKIEGKNFSLRRRKWIDLQISHSREESLEKDLLDSLGEMGVSDFMDRHVRTIRASSHLEDALKGWPVMEVLLRLCDRLGWDPSKVNDDGTLRVQHSPDSLGVAYWGARDQNGRRWAVCDYCWFGYELKEVESRPVVYFVFNGQGGKRRADKFIKDNPKVDDAQSKLDSWGDEWAVRYAPGESPSSLNDFDWFLVILGLST